MKQPEDTKTRDMWDEDKAEQVKWTATRLRTCWALRPVGALGTCGWVKGVPWTVRFVKHLPAGMEVEQ